MITRRDFLKLTGAGIAAVYAATQTRFVRRARAYQSTGLRKYIQSLRGVYPLDTNGIPVAIPDGERRWKRRTIAKHYTIDINQYTDQLHPDLGPTALRGYHSRMNLGGGPPQRHLGGIIVAQKGVPVQITFQNNLTGDHPLPVDPTVMGAELGPNRVSTHVHGGEVPWISDGGPFAWFDNEGNYGPSTPMSIYQALNPDLLPGQAEYYYPNNQSARFMWYHDHALGITRLNAYAGIASGYIIRDLFEGALRNRGLPDFIENAGRELPIVIQDKVFVDEYSIDLIDPSWPCLRGTGSLWYPHTYDAEQGPGGPPSDPSILPEMFGDTMLANGVAYPEATLEARRYRLRILNACQARFLNLQLYVDDSSPNSITLDSSLRPVNAKGPDFLVLGTDGGFLARPVLVPSNGSFDPVTRGGSLITAPAERWDLIVDFSGYEGQKVILYNDAPAPFPAEVSDPAMDFIGANGFGPETRQIMRFNIVPASGPADPPLRIDTSTKLALNPLSGIDWPLAGLWTTQPLPPPPGVNVRHLTLNEGFDEFGRLMQLLGTNVPMVAGTEEYGRAYCDEATETPRYGKVEVWRIANLSADTHPIHFHLANVQILSRRPFSSYANGTPVFSAPPRGPEPTELGWKETVKMHPNEVTTVIMRFNLPNVPFLVPASPRTGGHEYVWHCHILEHEEHDMMRPLIVT